MYEDVGNGGNGGDGEPPGDGGVPGADLVELNDPRWDNGRVLQAGTPGSACSVDLSQVTPSSLSFETVIGTTPCPQVIGTVTITNVTNEPVAWELDTGRSSIRADLISSAIEPGQSETITFSFDCSENQSFTATAVFTVFTYDQSRQETREVTITGTIS